VFLYWLSFFILAAICVLPSANETIAGTSTISALSTLVPIGISTALFVSTKRLVRLWGGTCGCGCLCLRRRQLILGSAAPGRYLPTSCEDLFQTSFSFFPFMLIPSLVDLPILFAIYSRAIRSYSYLWSLDRMTRPKSACRPQSWYAAPA